MYKIFIWYFILHNGKQFSSSYVENVPDWMKLETGHETFTSDAENI